MLDLTRNSHVLTKVVEGMKRGSLVIWGSFACCTFFSACRGGTIRDGELVANGSNSPSAPTPGTNGNPTSAPPPSGPQLAIYYGQGDDNGNDPPLSQVCATPQYNTVILSFVTSTTGNHTRNADGYPEMSINGCGTPYNDANPYL